MIPTVLMIFVAIVLTFTLGGVRRLRRRELRLERDNHAMQLELERHRQTAQSILRELDHP